MNSYTSTRKRVMLIQDPLAFFAMLGTAMTGNKSALPSLEKNEIAFKGFPTCKVLVTANNGRSITLKNNIEYIGVLERYDSDMSAAYVLPNVTHFLEIDNGDSVFVEIIQ